jgi:diphthine synthase
MGAAGSCGLHLYNFGATVSIPYFTEGWRPYSFWEKTAYNRKGGMHTLALLDIKTKEPDFEALARGKKVYLPPRFMSVNVALEQMLEAAEAKGDEEGNYGKDTMCVGMARLGQRDQCIKVGSMEELLKEDFGEPLHCLVVCADDVHELELEAMKHYIVEGSRYA